MQFINKLLRGVGILLVWLLLMWFFGIFRVFESGDLTFQEVITRFILSILGYIITSSAIEAWLDQK